jgi:heat shock protein HslJ
MKRTLLVALVGLIVVVVMNVLYVHPVVLPPATEDAHTPLEVNPVTASSTGSVTTPLVVPDFEGEADPSRMTLTMKPWHWVATVDAGGVRTEPRVANKFILTFTPLNTFSAGTDCDGVGGEYSVVGDDTIVLEKMISTLMFCEGSQEGEFSTALGMAERYHFTSKGELVLELHSGATMMFR